MYNVITKTIKELLLVPIHGKRKESKEFRKTKARLKKDGHYYCYICDCEEKLEVHHFGMEWCLENVCDFNKLKEFCEDFDPYGYGKLLKNIPITTVDDIRNCIVLCRDHHMSGDSDGVANGIHNITFNAWIAQKLAKEGISPVPEDHEELNEMLNEGKC